MFGYKKNPGAFLLLFLAVLFKERMWCSRYVRMERLGMGAGLNLQSGSFRATLSLTAKEQLSNPL